MLREKLKHYALLADLLEDARRINNPLLFQQELNILAARMIKLAYGNYVNAKEVFDVKPKRGERYGTYNNKRANGNDSLPLRDRQRYLLFAAQVITKGTAPDDRKRGAEAIRWLTVALRMVARGVDVELAFNVKPHKTEHKNRRLAIERENNKNAAFGMIHTLTSDTDTYEVIDGKIYAVGSAPVLSINNAIERITQRSEETGAYSHETLAAYWKREKARREAIRATGGRFTLTDVVT